MLATISVMYIYNITSKLDRNLFFNVKTTEGRGDISLIKLNRKKIYLIDESYNSNPLSLNSALQNFDKIKIDNNKKHIILGDMLELGKHSKKLHMDISDKINKISVKKVHVIGRDIRETLKKIKKDKRGIIFKNDSQLKDFMTNNLSDGDYLMVKGSNSTGLFNFISKLKQKNTHAL